MTLMTFLSYIVIGLLIGWLSRMITKERGMKLIPSLGFGVIGALTGTITVHLVGLSGAGFYAVVGAVGILFIVNVFRKKRPLFDFEDEEDDEEREKARELKKRRKKGEI